MEIRQAVGSLSHFVRTMISAGVKSKKAFNAWKKLPETIELMEDLFEYKRREGMPCINSLVTVDFHPEIPVMLLNYTQVAHNTLHEYPEGWTLPLRLCRGIVFDFKGGLRALVFEKFFNNGEHPETRELPDLPFEAPEKKDGHMGTIFEYEGKFYITTRGSFTSPTVKIATKMLQEYIQNGNWAENFNPDETVLVEIIHPQTHVLTDYPDFRAFILIGCKNRVTYEDHFFSYLEQLSVRLGLPLVRMWQGNSLAELKAHIKDRSVRNKEGFVVRFSNGLRVKFKFESYIGLMVQSKLSYNYLMLKNLSGSLEKMISMLDEEIYQIALQMLGRLHLIVTQKIPLKEKYQKLYQLVPEEECKDSFRANCRKFAKAFSVPDSE